MMTGNSMLFGHWPRMAILEFLSNSWWYELRLLDYTYWTYYQNFEHYYLNERYNTSKYYETTLRRRCQYYTGIIYNQYRRRVEEVRSLHAICCQWFPGLSFLQKIHTRTISCPSVRLRMAKNIKYISKHTFWLPRINAAINGTRNAIYTNPLNSIRSIPPKEPLTRGLHEH